MFSIFIRGKINEICTDCNKLIPKGMIRECCKDHEGFFARHINCQDYTKQPKWWVDTSVNPSNH